MKVVRRLLRFVLMLSLATAITLAGGAAILTVASLFDVMSRQLSQQLNQE